MPLENFGDKLTPPWPKGVSANAKGRPSAGAVEQEFLNQFAVSDLDEEAIVAISKNKREPVAKRAAALRYLRQIENPDLADYQPLLKGEMTLQELRESGVSTEAIKKLKHGEYGLEIELQDRSGQDFDRIMDRTVGKPTQAIDVTSNGDSVKGIVGIDPDKV